MLFANQKIQNPNKYIKSKIKNQNQINLVNYKNPKMRQMGKRRKWWEILEETKKRKEISNLIIKNPKNEKKRKEKKREEKLEN